jgi:hypothetical protein
VAAEHLDMRLPAARISDRVTERCVPRVYADQIAVCRAHNAEMFA